MRDAVATTTLPRAAKALKDSVGEMEYSLVTLPLLTSTLHGLVGACVETCLCFGL